MSGDETLAQLYDLVAESVAEAASLLTSNDGEHFLASDPAGERTIPRGSQTLSECSITNGELVYLIDRSIRRGPTEEDRREEALPSSAQPSLAPAAFLGEEEVDRLLAGKDGKIRRSRDVRYCKHSAAGMCARCQPLDPYDAAYLEANGIKHLSFHSYLRKVSPKTGPAGGRVTALEEPSYGVRTDCTRHAPYPAGICSACQPPAITLQRQEFRHVDHVEFDSPTIVEAFIAGWRKEGHQRFGWMYGRYEPHDSAVPLGIKAVVSHIYEPAQESCVDGFRLLDGSDGEDGSASFRREKEAMDACAALFSLSTIGMIYTDLVDDGTGKGTVECVRGSDTFFLSSAECIFIATEQMARPSPCRYAPSGRFGSKFVTVVVTGDEAQDGHIGLFPYQVSNALVAMVEGGLVEASTEPSLMLVRESAPALYVPDVIYWTTSEFGAKMQRTASPSFPVDYLIVSLTHGFPLLPNALFSSTSQRMPPPAGLSLLTTSDEDEGQGAAAAATPTKSRDRQRAVEGILRALAAYLLPIPGDYGALLRLLCNFNLVLSLYLLSRSCPELFSHEALAMLAMAVGGKDVNMTVHLTSSASWLNLLAAIDGGEPPSSRLARGGPPGPALASPSNSSTGGIARQMDIVDLTGDDGKDAMSPSSSRPAAAAATTLHAPWSCAHCTFRNGDGALNGCELCGLPRQWADDI